MRASVDAERRLGDGLPHKLEGYRMRIVGLGIIALAMLSGASVAASTDAAAQAPGLTATKDISAQRRQRARITVYPRRQALGPNAVRQCQTRLTQEYRPSGTVIFPRMYCWWE